MATNLKTNQLEVEELEEQSDSLFNVISSSTLACLALPVHPGVLKKYFVPTKGFEYLYTHPSVGLLVVSAVNRRQVSGTPKNKDPKHLDLLSRNIYSTASLQFWVFNHQAL